MILLRKKTGAGRQMVRQVVRAQVTMVGEDEVEVVMSTASVARDGHILLPQGCNLEAYRANPIILWQHDPEHPVGNAENVTVSADAITAKIRFAPVGTTPKSDEVRRLVKSGVVRAVSVGFEPLDGEPLDPKKPRGGMRITEWELLECSFVSVPADTGAVVTARSNEEEEPMADKDDDAGVETGDRSVRGIEKRALSRAPSVPKFRSLYDVANLAYMVESLGYAKCCADWEKAMEGDDSDVPEMLGEALMALGEALIAMTKEEVQELLDSYNVEAAAEGEDDDVLIVEEDRAWIKAAPNKRAAAWRRGLALAKVRAAKKLSDETVRCLRDSMEDHEEAMVHHRAAMRAHKRGLSKLQDHMDRSGVPGADKEAEEEDGDSEDIQKDGEDGDDEGSRNAEFRQRQADLLSLTQH